MKYILPLILAFILLIFAVSADTSDADVARIHVVANSDREEDIAIKMKVAEELAKLLGDNKFDSFQSIETGLKESLDEIISVSNDVLDESGAEYSASAEVGIRHFDKKSLGNSSFPEGDYLSLVVTLGKGEGHNWWSVIFPDVSLAASLAMGEEGSEGKTVLTQGGELIKVRCLLLDLYKFLLTKV